MRTTNKTEQNKQTKNNSSSSAINQRLTNITLAFLTTFFFFVCTRNSNSCKHVHVNEALVRPHKVQTNTLDLLSRNTHTQKYPSRPGLRCKTGWIAVWEKLSFFGGSVQQKHKNFSTTCDRREKKIKDKEGPDGWDCGKWREGEEKEG